MSAVVAVVYEAELLFAGEIATETATGGDVRLGAGHAEPLSPSEKSNLKRSKSTMIWLCRYFSKRARR